MSAALDTLKRTQALRDRVQQEIEHFHDLEERLADPNAASDPARLKQLSREHARLGARVEHFTKYLQWLRDLQEAQAVLEDSNSDPELRGMAREECALLEAKILEKRQTIELLLLPPDPNEGKGIIMEIRAGTGGDEAALFVGDLLKMYTRYAERHGLKVEFISTQATELGGYKEVVFSVQGPLAYENLHQEAGAHRVQRIPVTESGGRIHTSAVTVAVMPEVEEEEISIDEKDLKVDVFRASGAGGQHVNKTESAIRILHIPTGIVVSCQDERSQHKNRARGMRVLRARLMEKQARERHASESAIKKEQVGSGDRSERIRTYNFPQGRVTDHRVGYTSYNLHELINGGMDELIDVLKRARREERLRKIVP